MDLLQRTEGWNLKATRESWRGIKEGCTCCLWQPKSSSWSTG